MNFSKWRLSYAQHLTVGDRIKLLIYLLWFYNIFLLRRQGMGGGQSIHSKNTVYVFKDDQVFLWER